MSKSVPQALFISDFHIGEKLGSLRTSAACHYDKLNTGCYVREEFPAFLKDLKSQYGINENNKIKYLVVMGDQWDLAVQPMPYSFNLALTFFNNADLQAYIEEIIYIPGNHDHHIWRMYQTRYCVTEQLEQQDGQPTTDYPQVISGYLDLTGPQPQLNIENINGFDSTTSFVTGLTAQAKIPVHIVYPNLYIIYQDENGQKKATLCTHGHLFDAAWNPVTDAIYIFTNTFLPQGKRFNLHDIEMLNSPVTEFWNYSMAQIGQYNFVDKIVDLFLIIENLLSGLLKTIFETEKRKMAEMNRNNEKILDNDFILLNEKIFRESESKILHLIDDIVVKVMGDIKKIMARSTSPGITDKLSGEKNECNRSEFLYHNKDRVIHYLEESAKFLKKYNLQCFESLIYGHTHKVENATVFNPDQTDINLSVFNTGGWVAIDQKDYPELFLFFGNGQIVPLT